jgi:methylmalonic acid semialdehyde dehydrogenase
MHRLCALASQLVAQPTSTQGDVLKHFIGGKFVESAATSYVSVTNPATGVEIARVPDGNIEDVHCAVKLAAAAFPAWRDTPVKARVEVLFRFKSLLETHLKELTDLVVMEHGKNRGEAEAEILKGIETVSFAAGLPDMMAGQVLEVSRGVQCREELRPLGIVASVVPFNFPAMVPLWTLPISIACGNCLIMKPSEKVPLTLMRMAELLAEAGLPAGVFSLVHGTQAAAMGLVQHEGISAISFVGSSRVAQIIDKAARLSGKRSICLGGAKNHLIAMPDADENMAISDIMNSAFGSAGQRCMAASVLLVVKPPGHDRSSFVDALVSRARALQPGQGLGQIGPLIDKAAADRGARYITEHENNKGKVLLDGRPWQMQCGDCFLGPSVLLHESAQEVAMREEIFGPILSVLEVSSLDEAIAIENGNPYGNAAAIYTSSGETALETERLKAGMIGVNIGVPVPREPFSFGGINMSKFGDSSDITGKGAVSFWTQKIKITSKWTPPKKHDVITSSFIS